MLNMGNTEKRRGLCLPVMGTMRVSLTFGLLLWFSILPARADRYVVEPGTPGGTNAGAYTNWSIAATQIQWAVTAATNGETVWVTNGTYRLTNQIAIINGITNITVRSVNGRDVTIVNGNYPAYTNRCFYITNRNTVVDGLTISNGFAVTNSVGGAYGGGVYVSANGAYVQNCAITGNKAYCPTNNFYASGGGIYLNVNGTACVLNCSISYNTADSQKADDSYATGGGGVFVAGTGATIISNCVVFTNTAWCSTIPGASAVGMRGGGVNLYGNGLVVNCTIYNNSAQYRGGGVNAYAGGTIRNCVISNNWAPNLGSGISLEYGSTLAEGCLLVGNLNVAALQIYSGTARNCTIARNAAAGTFTWGAAYFDNIISYDNTGSDTSGGGNPPNPIYSNSCWLTGYSLTNGTGNISNSPQFVNAAAGNYRLANNSPCLNTGANRDWMTNAVDLDGRTRLRYGTVDIGAYERLNAGAIFGVR